MPEKFELKINGDEEKNIELEKPKKYFEYLKPLADVFSGYGVYSYKIDSDCPTFAFNHQKKEIIISTRLIEELKLESEEKKYVLLHEMSHLVQLLQDTDSYLESFEIPEEKAKEEKNPLLKKAYNNFFNIFLDIHANSIIRQRMPIYQKGEVLEDMPKNFYSKKLFLGKDYTDSPLSVQFLKYLLRRTMVSDEDPNISEEVKNEVKQKVDFFGREYKTLEEFVKKEVYNPKKTVKDVMFILKEFLMPVFEKLLKKDSEKISETPDFLGEFNLDENLTEEIAKEIADGIKKSKKTGSEKYEDFLKKKTEEWAKENGFSKDETKRLVEIKDRTVKVVGDLEGLWNDFIQKAIEIVRGKSSGFKTGATIASEQLAQQFPVLLTQPSEAKIFSRYLPETKNESIKPKKINLSLVVDLSGSMTEEKRGAVQEVVYAINKSLINFYRTGNLQTADSGEEFPITVDYKIIGFGSTFVELTERTREEEKNRVKKDNPSKDLDAELLRVILKIKDLDLGGTEDNLPLKDIKQKITPEIENNLKDGEEISIILEITDGATATVSESKALVEELNSKENVYCRAIQIPGSIYSEKILEKPEEKNRHKEILPDAGVFGEVWGENWGKQLKDLRVLKETVVLILYDALKHYAK